MTLISLSTANSEKIFEAALAVWSTSIGDNPSSRKIKIGRHF
jgi:hypothetical protein